MKLYMQSLGCVKNQVDSEMILGVMKEASELVATPDEADVIIINTCAFIEPARKEAIDTILEMAQYKALNNSKLIVCGCLAQRYKKEISELLPEVDRFITIDEYGQIGSILNSVIESDYHFNNDFSPLNKLVSTPNYMRYIKISEGCRNRCAFCAIPLIRGKLKSRTIEDIVFEVKEAIAAGAYEINLISQDTTAYGYDLYKRFALIDLLKELVKLDGDFKIRLLYLYPELVTDELLSFIKKSPKIYKYFDIPIQHSEDKILNAMHRRSNKKLITELIAKIRREIPNATLRTTLMVGFPYEEEEDVANLIAFIKEFQFDHLGAFCFSLEENTYACNYPNVISEAEKVRRYELLMEAQMTIAQALKKAKLGTIIKDAFIIGYDEESYMYIARSEEFAPDEIDGCIYVAAKNELALGQRINVKILDADSYTLTGEQVE